MLPIIRNFFISYNTKGNMKLLNESFQRQIIIKDFSKWFNSNIRAFISPLIRKNPNIKNPNETEEPVNEEPVNEEAVDKEPVNEVQVNEEQVNEEQVNEKPVNEEQVNEEKVVLESLSNIEEILTPSEHLET